MVTKNIPSSFAMNQLIRKIPNFRFCLFLQSVLLTVAHAQLLPTPPEVWKGYDPNKGDFKEEVVREETKDGILYKDSYVSAYVNGDEVRVFCKYAVKAGLKKAPGLLNVHGWKAEPLVSSDLSVISATPPPSVDLILLSRARGSCSDAINLSARSGPVQYREMLSAAKFTL